MAFSPFAILYELLTGKPLEADWIRAYLALGCLLLFATGVVLYADQASEQKVFAALGRFDPQPQPVPAATPYAEEINAAASRYDLNPLAIYYLIQIESGGRPLLVSPRGARGLMQIMPATWQALNPDGPCRGDHDPFICAAGKECIFAPWGNIRVGALYFSRLLRRYNGDYVAALQAYNAGQRHVVSAPPAKYAETRRYLSLFLALFRKAQEEQLRLGLVLSARSRRWLGPLFAALAGHLILGTLLFWRRQPVSKP
ncbi:MAG: transglycosylase SLT domain-containing protein [Bacillota bacterium]